MASRRLAISSLLCDDDPPVVDSVPDPVVLAPHLKNTRPHYVQPLGLDALVHAATEERRRLSVGDNTLHDSFTRSRSLLPPRPSPTVSPPYEYTTSYPLRHRALLPDENQVRFRPIDHHPPYFTPDNELIQHHQLLRQRQHHEQLLLNEQQQQRQLARERLPAYPNTSTSPSLSPPSRGPSIPLHLQVPSPSFSHLQLSPHPVGRKPDLGTQSQTRPTSAHLNLLLSQNSVPDVYASKKRRYSTSPTPPISSQVRERLSTDRENTADLSYNHADPLVVAIPMSPTQATSPHERKLTEVVEIVIPDQETERDCIPVNAIESLPDRQILINPVERITSLAAQAGRANVVTKSEEEDTNLEFKNSTPTERGRHHILQGPLTPGEERKRSRTRPATEIETVMEGSISSVKEAQEVFCRPQLPTSPPTKAQDAHEWFLQHYDEVPPDEPAAPPLVSPPIPPQAVPVASSSKKQSSTPVTMPEAAVALERELEELVVDSPTIPSKIEPDIDANMDVDLAMTELVVETLEPGIVQHTDMGMEVDVEDELLSLVDDRPSVPHASRHTSGPPSSVPSTKHPPFQAVGNSDARQDSPSAASNSSLTGNCSPVIRSSSAHPMSERGSMPPPASVAPGRGRDKDEKMTERATSITATAPTKKKKDGLLKASVKPKTAAAKPRAKSGLKPKPKDADGAVVPPPPAKTARTSVTPVVKKATASRSRSTSTMPGGSVGPEGDPKAEKQEEEEGSDGREDDKLYCVCKTRYDEDRFMIACDRCDEWYHTQCVNMSDLEVDLVDQFICPPCVTRNPHLSLRTTYKRRCLFGLKHTDPDSVKACHKPARGAFSKYCSDECGVKYMQTRLDAWAKKGGKKDKLWENVMNAEKREGVVISAEDTIVVKDESDDGYKRPLEEEIKPRKGKVVRELERLNGLLDRVVKLREEIKRGMEVVVWREKLIELASERAEQVSQCGWDQRLCFGDDEWADFGAGVLESYEDVKAEGNQGDMQVDGISEELGEWWCPGKKMCDRHAGWQAVRQKDVCQEKEKKEDALSSLTTREREIRKRIEDIVDPQGRDCADPDKARVKLPNAKQPNGSSRGKAHVDTSKGKKRKAPS